MLETKTQARGLGDVSAAVVGIPSSKGVALIETAIVLPLLILLFLGLVEMVRLLDSQRMLIDAQDTLSHFLSLNPDLEAGGDYTSAALASIPAGHAAAQLEISRTFHWRRHSLKDVLLVTNYDSAQDVVRSEVSGTYKSLYLGFFDGIPLSSKGKALHRG